VNCFSFFLTSPSPLLDIDERNNRLPYNTTNKHTSYQSINQSIMSIDPSGVGIPPLPIHNPVPNPSGTQVILPLEDFAEDLDVRLGRANGNVFQRRPGIEGCHDGQVMVRLKKKRFIVIDYSIVPNEHDLQASAMNPHINVPLGAGVTKCTGKVVGPAGEGSPLVQCQKVGVPVLLYDSEPNEPASLYLRSGLCFKCQRNLNEKRRTQRKKPADRAANAAAKAASKQVQMTAEQSQAAFLASHGLAPAVGTPVHNQQHQHQQHYNPNTVQIGGVGVNQTALIGGGSTGRVNSTPHHRVLMAVTNGHKKIKLAHTNQPLVLAPDAIILNGPPDNHSCKSVRTGHGFADIGVDLQVETHQSLTATQTLLHSVGANEMIQQGIPPPTPEDISRQYDNAFYSLSKSLYLLVQWKTSWDSAIAAAVAQEAAASVQANAVHAVAMGSQAQVQAAQHHHAQQQQQNLADMQAAAAANAAANAAIGMPGVGGVGSIPPQSPGNAGSSLAQAVASAAAVAAATTNGDGGGSVGHPAPVSVVAAGRLTGGEDDSAVEV
jgi:hypothetical protein